MNDAAWWARVVQARTQHDDLLPKRGWALRKGGHEAAIHVKAVAGIGAEIVLTVDGELRKTRLFRSHEHRPRVRDCGDEFGLLRGERLGVIAAEHEGING